MAECFDSFLSFRDRCDAQVPTSGQYTDQLGLHRTEIEKYMQLPYASAEAFFDEMFGAALNDVVAKINAKFMPKFKAPSIIDADRLGHILDNIQTETDSTGKMRGIEIEILNESAPLRLNISELSLFVDLSMTVPVYVYDLQQNKLIDTISITTVANENTTIYPLRSYRVNRRTMNIAFIYDVSLLDQYKTQLEGRGCGTCNPYNKYTRVNSWVNARGIEFNSSDTKIVENASSSSFTAGMSLVYSLTCNHRDWICDHQAVLALALNHKTVSTILNYGYMNSDRKNMKTIEDVEKLKKRIDFHEFHYLEIMDNVLRVMKPPKDKICFECNDRVKVVQTFG